MPDTATTLQILGGALKAPLPSAGAASSVGGLSFYPDLSEAQKNAPKDAQNYALMTDQRGWAWVPKGANGTATLPTVGAGGTSQDLLSQKLDILAQGAAGKLTPPKPEPQPSVSGAIANVGAGFNTGLAGLVGTPVEMATDFLNSLRGLQINPVLPGRKALPPLPPIQNPIGSAQSIKNALGYVSANPDTVKPTGPIEEGARSAGAGIAGMVLPFGAAKTALEALPAAGPVTRSLLGTFSHGSLPGNATIGTAAGIGGYAGEHAVPEKYAPLGNFVGQVAGGGITGGLMALGRGIAHGLYDVGAGYIAPFGIGAKEPAAISSRTEKPINVTPAQQRVAAQRLGANATGGRHALLGQLDEGLENPELVPGSEPTTYQVTGNQGIGQLERTQQTKNPDLFKTRQAEQNAARVNAIGGLAPTGDPAAVGRFFRDQLAAQDARQEAAVNEASQIAQEKAAGLGGTGTAQDYGQILRGHLADAEAAARAHESALWGAIDPEGKLALDVTPAKTAADQIAASVSEYARPPEGEEAAILGKMVGAPDVMKFSDLTDLRGRLLAAIRDERMAHGATPALRRMQQLRQALDDTIATGAERVAQEQEQAVAEGRLSPDQTMLARIEANLEAGRAAHYASANANGRAVSGGGTPSSGAYAGSGSRPIPGRNGATGSAGRRSPEASGNQSLQGEPPLTPNFDATAAQRYRNAADATRERAGTFGQGQVGQALRPGPTAGTFRLPDSQVAAKFFNGGKHAAEDVQSFMQAVGGRNEAVDTLQDYAASDLRRVAEKDGVLDPKKVETWLAKHKDALSAFPELEGKFRDAASAQETVDDLSALRAKRLKEQQSFAAQKFIGTDPIQAVGSALRSNNRAAEFAKLARRAGLDRTGEAKAGLKAAVLEYMKQSFESSEPAGETGTMMLKPKAVSDFLKKNRSALQWVFGADGVKTLENVAADLDRSYPTKTKLPAGPGTAQDLTGIAKHAAESGEGHGDNLLSYLVALGLEHHSGSFLTGLGGALAVKTANLFRARGLRTVDDLVTEAMLNPELARTLLAKITPKNETLILKRLTSQLATLGASAAVSAQAQ